MDLVSEELTENYKEKGRLLRYVTCLKSARRFYLRMFDLLSGM